MQLRGYNKEKCSLDLAILRDLVNMIKAQGADKIRLEYVIAGIEQKNLSHCVQTTLLRCLVIKGQQKMRQSFEDKCEMRGGMHFKMVDPRMCCNWLSIEEKLIMQSLEGIYFKNTLWLCHVAYIILVPQPRIKPRPTAVKAQLDCQVCNNHWIAREFHRRNV